MKFYIPDIKTVIRLPVLLYTLLSPIIITLFLLFVFPLISGPMGPPESASYGRCYLLTAVTLISAIPLINGVLFSYYFLVRLHRRTDSGSAPAQAESGSFLFPEIAVSAFLSFVLILPVIYLTDPVSTEGWLRSIYAAILLSVIAPFIFLFEAGFGRGRRHRIVLIFISVLYLITIPSGLMLHHPWNYFEFFSPLYWLAWAWVIASPAESLTYGIISLAVSAVSMFIFYRYFLRNSRTA